MKGILFDNWGIKLLSLVFALTLWFYVTSKGKTEMTVTAPLELRNIPQDMAVVGDVVGSLDVRLQGQERALRDITLGKKVVGVLDLSLSRVGENIVRLSPDDIRRPTGVTVTHMSLSEVKVKLEPLVRKTVRLRPLLHGLPAPGYRIAKVAASPPRVTVEGPASVVSAMDGLSTMPIDVQDAERSLSVEPKLDYQGRQVKVLDKDIAVRVTVERAIR
jgi:YbbR domain-containing protein